MSIEQVNKPQQASDEIDLIELFNRIGNSIKKGVIWVFYRIQDLLFLLIRKSVWILVFSIIGAFVVSFASTYFTSALPEVWLYALGGLFVLVTLYLPKGIVGLMETMNLKMKKA